MKNEEIIKIEERTKIRDEVEERIITFKTNNADYRYFKCIHDKNGSSYSTRYYDNSKTILYNSELSNEEVSEDLNLMLFNLETFERIKSIINVEIVRQQIFKDLNKKYIRKKK